MDRAAEMRAFLEGKYPGLPFHDQVATMILGQWARISIHDPATYIKSMARVLAQHSDATVLACADPATGISSKSDKLPTMKQLHDMLSAEAAAQFTRDNYAKKPQAPANVPCIQGPPPKLRPNLFVSKGFPYYDQMVARHDETRGENSRYENGHTCLDGEVRDGLWVPAHWYDERRDGRQPVMRWQRPVAKEIDEILV